MQHDEIVVLGGARTPFGKFGGSFKDVSATDLGVAAAKGALEASGVQPDQVQHVVFGNVIQSSRDAAYLAPPRGADGRHAHHGAWPDAQPAVRLWLRGRRAGRAHDPLRRGRDHAGRRHREHEHGSAGDAHGPLGRWSGRGADPGRLAVAGADRQLLQHAHGHHGRERGPAVQHQPRWSRTPWRWPASSGPWPAGKEGRLPEEVVPTEGKDKRGKPALVTQDEHIRPETTAEGLAKLPARFIPTGGTVTAGNASGIVDGAAALVDRLRQARGRAGAQAAGPAGGLRHRRCAAGDHGHGPRAGQPHRPARRPG